MKLYTTKTLLIITALLTGILQSCEKKELTQIQQKEQISEQENNSLITTDKDILYTVTVEHGMLNFKDDEHLKKCNQEMAQMTSEELQKWETSLSFKSQQRILEQATKAEFAFVRSVDTEKMSKEELNRLYEQKKKEGYTEFTQKYIDAGLIEANSVNDPFLLELTIASWVHPRFLNKDGMVKIGSTIYQFTPILCKKLDGADFNKLSLLRNTKEDKPKQSITIGYLTEINKDFHGEIAFSQEANGSSWGDKKIKASIWIRRWDYPSSGVKTYLYYLKYQNYIYKWWDWKQDTDADTYGYAFVSAVWNSGEDIGYINYSDNNTWSNNIHVLWLYNIPYSESVTFKDSNYSWFKRNDVPGINMSHLEISL